MDNTLKITKGGASIEINSSGGLTLAGGRQGPAGVDGSPGGGDLNQTDINTLAKLNAIVTDATLGDVSALQEAPAEGAFVDGDKTKLDGIEANATADQTGAEIKIAYEAEANTNAFTDAEQTKLSGIETGATADQDLSGLQPKPAEGQFVDGDKTKLDAITGTNTGDQDLSGYALSSSLGTAAALDVGTTANLVVQLNASAELPAVSGANLTDLPSGATQLSDLSDVNTSAPTNRNVLVGDGVDFESRALVEADISNLGTYSTATGVEDNADVTDTANVTAAGALMDSEVTNLAAVKAFDPVNYAAALGVDDNYVTDAEKVVIGNTSGTNTGDQDLTPYNDGQLGIVIDGAGTAIATGYAGDLRIPYDCTITGVEMMADQSGSIVIDVWKDTYANAPLTDADSITASAPPTLSAAQKSVDSTLTGWTTALTKGDYLAFNVDSAATITRTTLTLIVTKL